MLGTWEYSQPSHTLWSEFVLWEHTFDRLGDDQLWALLAKLLELSFFEAARETAVTIVHLVSFFGACHDELARVDDDDIIATIDVGSGRRLVLTDELFRDFGRNAAERRVFCVDEYPSACDVSWLL